MRCANCNTELNNTDICPGCGRNVRTYKKMVSLSNRLYNEGLEKASVRDLSGAVVSLRQSLKLDKNNIDVTVADAPDGSGMKVADKYQTGMDPNGGETFAMKDMSMEVVSSTVKATVTVPACTPPSGSVVKIQTSANKSSWTDGATLAPGATSAQLTLQDGNVTYFRMVLEK